MTQYDTYLHQNVKAMSVCSKYRRLLCALDTEDLSAELDFKELCRRCGLCPADADELLFRDFGLVGEDIVNFIGARTK